VFLSALFLRKLPADVRILLAHMDHTRLKELATAADQLVAAVEADPGEVTARGGGAGAERKPAAAVKQKKKKPLEEPEPSKAARLAARLCLRHWRFGAQAFRCDGDCCWPGNGRDGGN
jgi:ribosomal protein L12E/L44/L45/RPP1/RPP2